MIMSVSELRQYVATDKDDQVLGGMLQALEILIRAYTNNNFQMRAFRSKADIVGDVIVCESLVPIREGDTLQVSESRYNDGLYTVDSADGPSIRVKGSLIKENRVLLTKVVYPLDVKMGVVNMVKWDLENRDKVGIQSETISRHSVTYFNMDGDNSEAGYPKSLLGFLKPYRKARF